MSHTLTDRKMLFPCAAGVQMPQIGSENSQIKITLNRKVTPSVLPMTIMSQDMRPADKRYVKMVSSDLCFAQDVIEDRALDTMPFSNKYFKGVFEPGELVTLPKRSTSVMGRHNKRGYDSRHMPCMLKKIVKPSHLTPLRKQAKEKALGLHKEALILKEKESMFSRQNKMPQESQSEAEISSFFMTELESKEEPGSKNIKPMTDSKESKLKSIPESRETNQINSLVTSRQREGGSVSASLTFKKDETLQSDQSAVTLSTLMNDVNENDWDDHLMSRLSKLTANWIVHEKLGGDKQDKQKDKLSDLLESWYGRPVHTDLVREQASDEEDEEKAKEVKPVKKWKKTEASVLRRVYNIDKPQLESLDVYSDDNKAPFYRQPAGIRKKRRSEEKEEAATGIIVEETGKIRAINATAHHVTINGRPDTPPRTLRDMLTPRVGDKIYNTDNAYQQEWLTGGQQVFKVGEDSNEITMETSNKYKKKIQRGFPQRPETWYTLNGKAADVQAQHIPEKGHRRWVDLPEPIDETEGLMAGGDPGGFDPSVLKAVDPKQRRKVKSNHALVTIVHDWRSKWFLSGQFADSTPDDLIRDMADIQPHVRLKAIGTVAKASEYKPPPDDTVMLESTEYDPVRELPEKMFVALECLLEDSHGQVKKAAAITLYSLDRPSQRAKEELRNMLLGSSSVDRWAASQCLASFGECDSDVVAEIIKQILTTEVAVKLEQGIHLLAKISNSSQLVHCMVAEQLNSSSWRHRVIACKIMPTLHGSINRDITQKLSELMWHDWHAEVRSAAAQCLGKTSHGRDVHDDIRSRILNGDERTKMEAINKLGQLGIMTAKLLPAFLECFADSYVSIRSEVCITCGNLAIKEESVLERLVHLATFDPIWKVKALGIQALGKIGVVNEDIKECLLWAMRYEERAGVRAEACHSLILLDIQEEDVLEALQDRLLVESDPMVREEMMEALSMYGLSAGEDMDMVARVKGEVRKLCTRNIIASQIIVNENDDTKRSQLNRMVCQTEEDIEAMDEKKAELLQRIRSTATRHSDSMGGSPQPRTSTPFASGRPSARARQLESEGTTPDAVSREGTVFTPTADNELEAILNQDDMGSASGGSVISGAKSRPETGVSEVEDEGEAGTGQEESDDMQYSNITITKADDDEDGETVGTQPSSEGHGTNEGLFMDDGSSKQNSAGNHVRLSVPPSAQKASRMDLLSPMGSFGDMKGSRLSMHGFSGDRRSVYSRDSLREREKINLEVNAIYTDLNARYQDMVADLIKIDKGFNAKGSSNESSYSVTPSMLPRTPAGLLKPSGVDHQVMQELLKKIEGAENNSEVEEKDLEHSSKQQDEENQFENSSNQQTEEGNTYPESGEDEKPSVNTSDSEQKAEYPEAEWKSYADTISEDGESINDDATSYPSYDDNADVDIARSQISTAGYTAHASEYESERGLDSDDEGNM